MKECPNCGALLDDVDAACRYCNQPADGKARAAYQPPHAPEPPPIDPEPPRAEQPGPEKQPAGQESREWKEYRQPYAQQPPPPGGQQQGHGHQPPPPPPPGYGRQHQGPPPGGQPPYGQQYQAPPPGQQPYGQQYQGPPPGGQPYPPYPPGGYRDVNRIACGVLAILLGVFGVHKFYMGRTGVGIVCVLFCWTGIPAIVGLIEGIIYLCMDDYSFREKYCRRY